MLLENLIFTGYQYSALRLGEGNFRLGLYGELATYGDLTFEETLRDAIASLEAPAQTGLQVSARWCDKMSAKDAIAPPTLASDSLGIPIQVLRLVALL